MTGGQCSAGATGMDRDDDRAAELIARNRLLLALAEETHALARDAIERAEDAVRSTMEIRLVWAKVWAAQWDDPKPPDLP